MHYSNLLYSRACQNSLQNKIKGSKINVYPFKTFLINKKNIYLYLFLFGTSKIGLSSAVGVTKFHMAGVGVSYSYMGFVA